MAKSLTSSTLLLSMFGLILVFLSACEKQDRTFDNPVDPDATSTVNTNSITDSKKTINTNTTANTNSVITALPNEANTNSVITALPNEAKSIWQLQAYLKASNANAYDYFGSSVSISGDTAIVGAWEEDSNQTVVTSSTGGSLDNTAAGAGSAYIYRRVGSTWAQEAYLKASNANPLDKFGSSVSISGDTVIVGAYGESSNQTVITNGQGGSLDNTFSQSGASYIFRRSGSLWAEEAYLKASNANASDSFGGAVSISGDTVIVGAVGEDSIQRVITNGTGGGLDNYSGDAGAGYIYRRSGAGWTQMAYLKASNANASNYFGSSVSISGDTAIVGAYGESSSQAFITNGTNTGFYNGSPGAGASYIFRRVGLSWKQEAYLKASNANGFDNLGTTVSISGDTAIVGASKEDSNQTVIINGSGSSLNNAGLDVGASYIFRRSSSFWTQEAYLKASNANSGDWFGSSVSISGDTVVVGAYGEGSNQTVVTNGTGASLDNTLNQAGASYIYRRTGSGWSEEAYLKASNTNSGDSFGSSVSISGDTVIVGAHGEDSNQTTITNGISYSPDGAPEAGAVYVYRNLSRMFEPTDIASTVTSSSFTINWNSSNLGTGNGNVKVVYATTTPASNCSSGTLAYEGTATSVSVSSGLTPGQRYIARLCAFNGVNYSDGVTIEINNDDIGPNVLSINRGSTPNPVPWGTSQIDYIVTFTEPVFNLNAQNFSFTEVDTTSGSTGQISSISCTGAVCTVRVVPGLPGNTAQLRLDLRSTSSVVDFWGNSLAAAKTGDQTFTLLPTGWAQEAYLKASNANAYDNFGSSVSISGDTAIVGAHGEDANQTVITNGPNGSTDNTATNAGASYIYRRYGSNWAQEAYIKACNANASDNFGRAVSLSGDTAAVGALQEDSSQTVITNGTGGNFDNSALDAGAVYIYRRNGSLWIQEAFLKASNANDSDLFGSSVSISKDTVIIGAYKEGSNQTVITNGSTASTDNSLSASGASYIYRRSGSLWAQEAYLKASNANASDYFGSSVSISADTAIVGAYGESSNQTVITSGTNISLDNSASAAGASYIYKREGTSWILEAYLKASNANTSDYYGSSVSISGDTAIVGAYQESSNQTLITNGTGASLDNTFSQAGAGYIYRRTGSAWAQEAYLKASNANASDNFGSAVSISGDTAIVGAYRESSNQTVITNGTSGGLDNSFSQAGASYIYRRSGSLWIQEAYVKASNANASDLFGSSVSLSGDTAIVGAYQESSNQTVITNGTSGGLDNSAASAGAVYVYRNLLRMFEPTEIASTVTSSSFTLGWKGSNLGTANGAVKVVYATTSPSANCSSGSVAYSGTATSASVSSGLTPGQTYIARICAYDGAKYTEGILTSFTVKGDDIRPTVISITRGSTPNPVAPGTSHIDYIVTFSEPVYNLKQDNFSLTDIANTLGFKGRISSLSCTGTVCSARVILGLYENPGQLRLDLTNPTGVVDNWGNSLAAPKTGDETFTLLPTGWYQESYIKASNADPYDLFGLSLSISGDTAIVGAYQESSNQTFISNGTSKVLNNIATYAGATYIYRRVGSAWTQESYLKASNATSYDYFGSSVSVSGDTVIVGASQEQSNQTFITNGTTSSLDYSASAAGAGFIYRRYGSSWAQEAYLKASNADRYDLFGSSVSISGDTAIVGVGYEDSNQTFITNGTSSSTDNTAQYSGASYIYQRSGSNWAQQAYIKASNANDSDFFGSSVSISGDTAIVSAFGESSNQTFITNGTGSSPDNTVQNSGASYIYRRTGSTWSQEAYLKASNANASDGFGGAVSISGDTVIVGAGGEDSGQSDITNGTGGGLDNYFGGAGAGYIFRRSGAGWTQMAYLKASNANSGDWFGSSVSISGDTVVVGAYGEGSNQTVVTNGTGASLDNTLNQAGASYIYRRTGSGWSEEAYLKASNTNSGDSFGSSVSISGDTVIVGAHGEDSNQTTITNGISSSPDGAPEAGAVYVYRNLSRMFEPTDIASTVTSSSFTINWNSSNLGTGNGNVKVVYATTTPASNCSSGTLAYEGTATSVSVSSGLTPGQRYIARLCAFNGVNYSDGVTIEINNDDIGPNVLSINRGSTPNPVPWGTSQIDYIVTFTEPVFNLNAQNFSFTEVDTTSGATGQISSISCTGAVCTVRVVPGLPGNTAQLRLDLRSTSSVVDFWGNSLAAAKTGDQTFTLLPTVWYQESYLKASNANEGDWFGSSASISGDTVIVGAYGEDANQTVITNGPNGSTDNTVSDAGASYIYRRTGSIWAQEAYLKASNANSSDYFGNEVSISGHTAIVGASGEDSSQTTIINGTTSSLDNTASAAGASYIYRRNGSLWIREAFLKASNANAYDWFGSSVAISGDTAIICASGEDSNQTVITNGSTASTDNSLSASGASYIYRRSGSLWAQEAYLKASNANASDYFGESVSISADTAIVGAHQDSSNQTFITNGTGSSTDNTAQYSGASYIYRRTGSTWSQEAYLKASNANNFDSYGFSVSISGDTAIVGAYGEASNQSNITNGTPSSLDNNASLAGASYIYRRTGATWAQEAYVKASNANANDIFGISLALSGDTAIVGAQGESSNQNTITNGTPVSLENTASGSGATYIYRRRGSVWTQESYLKASNADASDSFGGRGVSISGDTVVVGAYEEDSGQTVITNWLEASTDNSTLSSGAVYVYRNLSRIFDPDLIVSDKTNSSITLSWGSNLGSATRVKIAPAVTGTNTPLACTDLNAITLAAGSATYTYSGLNPGTKYGFRVCGFDGSTVGQGAVIWETTK